MAQKRTGYPSDVSDEEWALCAPYLVLLREDARQRVHSLRSVFNAVRYLVKAGCGWRMLPNDLPPWPAVQQQTQRWIKAGCFERLAHDLREVLRVAAGREAQPTAVILDMLQHDLAGGLGLRVQGIEADESAGEIEPLAERAHGRDFVGLVGHHLAAQVVQAGRGDGADHVAPAAVTGHLTVAAPSRARIH